MEPHRSDLHLYHSNVVKGHPNELIGTDQGILTEQSQRPEHVAIALHTAASIYFQLKDPESGPSGLAAEMRDHAWVFLFTKTALVFTVC